MNSPIIVILSTRTAVTSAGKALFTMFHDNSVYKMANLTLHVPRIVTSSTNKPTRCTFCMYFSTIFLKLYMFRFQPQDRAVRHVCTVCTELQKTVNLWTPEDERNSLSKLVELQKYCRKILTKSASCWFV